MLAFSHDKLNVTARILLFIPLYYKSTQVAKASFDTLICKKVREITRI
jgi:hypothetical protein